MIRPGLLAVFGALAVTAAVPMTQAPVVAALPPPAPGPQPAATLVPGALLQDYVVMVFPPAPPSGMNKLDRVALAVEGAESNYGRNPLMWRPDPNGPQGPMQVSAAAATDVGGGDRFDLDQNRALGRAYLARMYAKYGNWRDALMAYNWGPANLDQWIGAGRPTDALDGGVSRYALRVLDNAITDDTPLAIDARVAPPGPPPRPEIHEETIRDAHLRQRVHANNRAIAQLRAVVEVSEPGASSVPIYTDKTGDWLKTQKVDPDQLAAADPTTTRRLVEACARTVLTIAREVSRRPGNRALEPTANAGKTVPELGSIRTVAGVLLEQLEDENDTLALIDRHRRDERAGDLPKPERPGHVRG